MVLPPIEEEGGLASVEAAARKLGVKTCLVLMV